LSYELYVVQLPYLNEIDENLLKPNQYRSKLYALLKLFDQEAKKIDNEYRLRLFRKLFPEFLDRVIKRLQTADIDNPNLEKQMQAEDHYLKPLLRRDNKISWLLINKKETEEKLDKELKKNKEKDKALGEKDKALGEKDKALEEKDKALGEKDKALGEKDKALGEKDKALGEKDKELKSFQIKFAKSLKDKGMPVEEIQEETTLTKEEIEKL